MPHTNSFVFNFEKINEDIQENVKVESNTIEAKINTDTTPASNIPGSQQQNEKNLLKDKIAKDNVNNENFP